MNASMNVAPSERRLVNIMQACDLAGVSRRTIYNWLAAGKVEYVRAASGRIRIYADTLFRPADPARHPKVG